MKRIILALLTAFVLTSCGIEKSIEPVTVSDSENTTQQTVISVSSSIVPIASVVNAIGGEYVEVNTIVPAGVSPHGFDLSAQDVVAIENSDIAFMIGLQQIDGFLEKALENKKHVELAEGMELLKAAAHDHSEHEDEHDEHSVDAHVWLGQENISTIAEKVRDELSLILPEQAEFFAENTETFKTELTSLYTDFAEKTDGKTPREFIVFHDAYNYLMQSAGIDSDLKIPFSENVLHETGTAHMVELIEEVELHGIVNIFSEPQFSNGNIQDFANEYNLTLGILDPLGTDDSARGYLENLEKNLTNLSLIYE